MEMLDKAVFVTALLAALGAGLMAGLFFIFSNTIMRSLGRLPSADGMAAMQSINTTIQNPLFLGVFMGAGLLSVLAIIFAFVDWRYSSSVFLIAGGIFYLAGSLLVTMVFNVPMNKALDAAVPGDAGGEIVARLSHQLD